MGANEHKDETTDIPARHVTTRRGFVSGLGFGVVSLYSVWAAYGAAPTSLSLLSPAGEGAAMGQEGAAMGHGGSAMGPEEFRRLAYEFIEANSLPDGSVRPQPSGVKPDHTGQAEGAAHGGGMAAMGADAPRQENQPIDVYVMASRYGYEPGVLRLQTGVPYRFRIMAVDADHGMSIRMRLASHMIRCPARTLLEREMTFQKPGELLVYCSVYCGEGHDLMQGLITVA